MIRRATTDDIPSIRQMAYVSFRDTYRNILSNEQMEYMLDWMYSESSLLLQMTQKSQFSSSKTGKDMFHSGGRAGQMK